MLGWLVPVAFDFAADGAGQAERAEPNSLALGCCCGSPAGFVFGSLAFGFGCFPAFAFGGQLGFFFSGFWRANASDLALASASAAALAFASSAALAAAFASAAALALAAAFASSAA
ncbi:MAG: hypothetical protein HZT40_22580 [Candidatus Thiothrix singaporensis]|uniref:Uncharacterized protein n=1 Tax=Candidatus Thiothrix singaporensis TaxID=2799669 RepID=A0A7L6AY13_9GAMM|nr:MAG: hypothetical protein HZT40_22580 [Candidatus Thiothrix singaporensis]